MMDPQYLLHSLWLRLREINFPLRRTQLCFAASIKAKRTYTKEIVGWGPETLLPIGSEKRGEIFNSLTLRVLCFCKVWALFGFGF